MSNYSIGLSGLQTSSQAMDVISNNIANSSTVGYRAGEYIFEDQFYKALNPMDTAREGMGASKQNVRRLWNMGSIQSSANTLDMAITGAAGLFRLSGGIDDPSQTFYTRNGQFAISKETDPSYPKRSYIVNENGMYLTGYTSNDGKELTNTHNHRITMPPVTIEPVTTTRSTTSVTLDARQTAFLPEGNKAFDPDNPLSYNNKISQTVYHLGDSGNPHTLSLYYRRVEDKNLSVKWDGTYLKYQPSAVADPKSDTEQKGAVTENDSAYVVLSPDSSGPNFTYLSSADRQTLATVGVSDTAYVNADISDGIQAHARLIVNGRDTGAVVLPNIPDDPSTANTNEFVQIQSTGVIEKTTTQAGLGTAESTLVKLSGDYKIGDIISVKVKGETFTETVAALAAGGQGTPLTAAVDRLVTKIEGKATALGLLLTNNDIPVTTANGITSFELKGVAPAAGAYGANLDVAVDANRALQLSEKVTIPENAEIGFFNPVTTSKIESAGAVPQGGGAPAASNRVLITSSDQSIQPGQFVWRMKTTTTGNPPVATRTFENLDLKVMTVSNKELTLSKPVSLAAGETLVFYQPVTYSVLLQDGTKVAMTGDHKGAATAANPQEFIAVTSQVEVYGSLDGTMFNGTDSRFSSDTAIDPTIEGGYDPLATLQFWGGQNIDAIRFDPVTGQPAYESTVKLKGIVTSSGKTNGVDFVDKSVPASETHPMEFDLDLTGTQHYATTFSVDANYQDGYPTSMLNTVTIDDAGKLVGVYTDGREFIAGQVVLVHFPATNGLIPVGNNVFQSSYMSGNEVSENVIVGKPGERGLGGIRSASVEGSNVDLANELVKLMIQQRMYSANSQSIRAFDDTLTTTIRMTGG